MSAVDSDKFACINIIYLFNNWYTREKEINFTSNRYLLLTLLLLKRPPFSIYKFFHLDGSNEEYSMCHFFQKKIVFYCRYEHETITIGKRRFQSFIGNLHIRKKRLQTLSYGVSSLTKNMMFVSEDMLRYNSVIQRAFRLKFDSSKKLVPKTILTIPRDYKGLRGKLEEKEM